MAEKYNSQEFADYFNESRYVVDDKDKSDDSLDEDYKNEDCEGQLEWFQKVGLNREHFSSEDGREVEEEPLFDFMMALTPRQATLVRKKVATYKATVRKRRASKSRIPDVREVFSLSTSITTTTITTSESISSNETRSRSETPDSLGSLSPCDSTPSSPDWDPQPGSVSVSSSQGYHSHPRNSPNSPTPSFATNMTNNLNKQPKTSKSNTGSTIENNDYLPSDQEWEKVSTPDCRLNAPSSNYDPHSKFPSNMPMKEFPFMKIHRNKFDQVAKTMDSNSGIETFKFKNIGSWYGGARGLDISLPSHLEISENDISIDVRDEGDQAWDFEYAGLDASDEDLPNFRCVADKAGTTYIIDLSNEDVLKIQSLACIEFAIIADSYRIQFYRRKGRKKRRKDENSIFGVPLTTLIQHDRKLSPKCKIPLILENMLNYLERSGFKEEGILRVPGSSHKKDLLKMELEHNFYTNPPSVAKAFQMCATNDIIAILKCFIRELPNPLFTNDYIDAFFQLDYITDSVDQIKAMKLLVMQLPEVHRNTLWALLSFLSKVAENEKYNRMSLQNVAMIMAPNLFLSKPIRRNDPKRDLATEMNLATSTCRLTKIMIKYREILFTVPSFMLKQIRTQHESAAVRKNAKENNRPKKWLLNRKTKADIYRKINNEVDFQAGIIRVQAPQFNVLHLPILLKPTTSASDVVLHVLKSIGSKTTPPDERRRVQGRMESRRAFSEIFPNGINICSMSVSDMESVIKAHYLYEVGGNIGERRLHQDTSVIAVYQENPNAEWVIRCHHPQL